MYTEQRHLPLFWALIFSSDFYTKLVAFRFTRSNSFCGLNFWFTSLDFQILDAFELTGNRPSERRRTASLNGWWSSIAHLHVEGFLPCLLHTTNSLMVNFTKWSPYFWQKIFSWKSSHPITSTRFLLLESAFRSMMHSTAMLNNKWAAHGSKSINWYKLSENKKRTRTRRFAGEICSANR